MTRDLAIQIVQDAIMEQLFLAPTQYTLTTDIYDHADSLDVVEITLLLEQRINTEFPKDLSKFKTVGDIVDFVEKYEVKI